MVDPAQLTDDLGKVALAAALIGAAAIQSIVAAGTPDARFKSGGHDLVTVADRESERAVIQAIRSARPDDSIVGEEGGGHRGTSDIRWLVDPLDGTANFVYGRTDYAVSVGAEAAGRPVAGAIVRPTDNRWVMAGRRGAWTGGESPSGSFERAVSPIVRSADTGQALVAFGLPYPMPERARALTVIARLVPRLRGVRILGCAAGDLAAVALGQCDAFIGFGLAEWDTAAGEAIVTAAGGEVRHVPRESGRPTLVAGSDAVVDKLATMVLDP